jgi:hypothetical protein
VITTRTYCLVVLLAALALASCNPFKGLTRVETDTYTIAQHDTVVTERVRNIPAQTTDTSRVAQTSKVVSIRSTTLSYDSVHDRKYPDFLRAGGVEVAGLFASSSLNGIGGGPFGLYSLFNGSQVNDTGGFFRSGNEESKDAHLFKGELIRIMPFEKELRWFDDAPNWTVGWSAFEYITPDEGQSQHALMSVVANLYARRRIYIRDQIPYLIFSPFMGVSAFPSAYVNLGGELQFGSLGGMNMRAYAGLASGFSWVNSAQSTFPYFGLGFSVLDFTNRLEETQREWKDYVLTTTHISVLEGSLIKSFSNAESAFQDTTSAFTGGQLKFANVQIPLPFADYHFWAGTSLINWMALGFDQQAFGVLPLRAGYRQYILSQHFMLEPYVELNYYPSTMVNAALRLKYATTADAEPGDFTSTGASIAVTLGFATGSSGDFSPQLFNSDAPKVGSSFSTAYFGISIGLGEMNWTPETIRAAREREIPSKL